MKKTKDVSELINLKVTHVSYVTKGANKKRFFLTKDEKGEAQEEVELNVRIVKSDNKKQRVVYGVVAEPDSVDTQGHKMTADTIEKAAHNFLKNFGNIDEMHDFVKGAGEIVESFVALADMVVNGETIKKGSWVLVTKATDEIFEKIESGEYTGYSLAGFANIAVNKIDEAEAVIDEVVVEKVEENVLIVENTQKEDVSVVVEKENVITESMLKEIIKKSFDDMNIVSIFSEQVKKLEDKINSDIELLKASISEKSVDDIEVVPTRKTQSKKKMTVDEEKASIIF